MNSAVSSRISQLSAKDYKKALEELVPKPKNIVNHEENMKRFGKK